MTSAARRAALAGTLGILFAREPIPGRVKTRLAPRLGAPGAASLYAGFLEDCLAALGAAGLPAVIACTPDSDPRWFAHTGRPVVVQSGADLGLRMAAALDHAHAAGYARAIIFGSDSPTVPIAVRQSASLLVGPHPLVLAPDGGGGYWALGARRGTDLGWLAGMEWGHAGVLAATEARVRAAGIAYALGPPWNDVDEPADLERLARELALRTGYPAAATRRALAAIG